MVASYTDYGEFQTGGALRSTNNGVSWSLSSSGLAAGCQGFALSASPDNVNTFYLADGDTGTGLGGLFMTTDAGQHWTGTGYAGYAVRDVVVDPRDADTILHYPVG